MVPSIKTVKARPKKQKIQKYVPTKIESSNVTKCVIEEEKKQFDVNLLLAYTHFLNGYEKHISIGYNPVTLLPAINIVHNSKSKIVLTTLDWMHLLANSNEITKCLANNGSAYFKCDTTSISIIHVSHNNENVIIMQDLFNNANCITLSDQDWMQIYTLFDFYKSMYDWFTLYAHNIKIYYDQYVNNCTLKHVYTLQTHDFFAIEDTYKNTFNQLRLFHEIPVICKQNLILDVELLKLYKQIN